MLSALVLASCKNNFEMEKPSEIAVSNLKAVAVYNNNSWSVQLTWFYDSADPANYLIVCRLDKSDGIYEIDSGKLLTFKTHEITDTLENPGKYTYTVYTVGNGYSTSASTSVTVNCEYPSYNGGSSGSSSLGNTRWTNGDQFLRFYNNGTVDYYNGSTTQTCNYNYSSGSGKISASHSGQSMDMFSFTISGTELYLNIAPGMDATFYKD